MSVRQINAPSWKINTWTVFCDFCSNQIKKLAIEAGDAAENAHKEGYIAIPGSRVESPMKWMCLSCSSKKPHNVYGGKVKNGAN